MAKSYNDVEGLGQLAAAAGPGQLGDACALCSVKTRKCSIYCGLAGRWDKRAYNEDAFQVDVQDIIKVLVRHV